VRCSAPGPKTTLVGKDISMMRSMGTSNFMAFPPAPVREA